MSGISGIGTSLMAAGSLQHQSLRLLLLDPFLESPPDIRPRKP